MTNKIKYFIGNWKMFGDFGSFKIIYKVNRFCLNFLKHNKRNKVIFCVPNTLISSFAAKLNSNYINIGAQNCYHKNEFGPFTGAINASMIKKAGAKYIILGHSENRAEGETNLLIKKKIEFSFKEKLNVIFCIGETLKEKKKKKTFFTLKKQIKESIQKNYKSKNLIIAYEPVWSIGTGKIPKPHDLIEIFRFIKKEFKNYYKTKKSPRVIYGGSVNSHNIGQFSSISEIDGFLIGAASQSSKKFIDIIKNYYK